MAIYSRMRLAELEDGRVLRGVETSHGGEAACEGQQYRRKTFRGASHVDQPRAPEHADDREGDRQALAEDNRHARPVVERGMTCIAPRLRVVWPVRHRRTGLDPLGWPFERQRHEPEVRVPPARACRVVRDAPGATT
jgi:hypothetical protein